MAETAEPTCTAMLFERNDALVLEAFRRGEFDYLEGAGEVSETEFFRAMTGGKVLQKLADTYPSPHKKHDVPLWVYIASDYLDPLPFMARKNPSFSSPRKTSSSTKSWIRACLASGLVLAM